MHESRLSERIKPYTSNVLAIIASLSLFACNEAPDSQLSTEGWTVEGQTPEPEGVLDTLVSGSIRLRIESSEGSINCNGWAINDGQVATAGHCLEGADGLIYIASANGSVEQHINDIVVHQWFDTSNPNSRDFAILGNLPRSLTGDIDELPMIDPEEVHNGAEAFYYSPENNRVFSGLVQSRPNENDNFYHIYMLNSQDACVAGESGSYVVIVIDEELYALGTIVLYLDGETIVTHELEKATGLSFPSDTTSVSSCFVEPNE